jgi:Zn-dependent M16 (insulinase) family peptidase
MVRYLTGDTEEARQRMRDEILGTNASDFKDFARILEQVKENGIVKVLGSPSAIEKAATKRPGWLDIVKVL